MFDQSLAHAIVGGKHLHCGSAQLSLIFVLVRGHGSLLLEPSYVGPSYFQRGANREFTALPLSERRQFGGIWLPPRAAWPAYKLKKNTGAIDARTAPACRASTPSVGLGAFGNHLIAKKASTGICPAMSSCHRWAVAPSSASRATP